MLAWVYGAFLAHPLNLATADLGRHIRNGEFVFKDSEVLSTNFYSYTAADWPVINHHWGAGVIFYLIWRLAGFSGLHVFFIALSLATFLIFYKIAQSRAGTGIAALVALGTIPLLAERAEIRPEAFTYFFSALFFLILWKAREGKISKNFLWLLPALEIIWANTHIYFFLGPAIITAFLIENLAARKEKFASLLKTLALTALATLLNPFGLRGVLEPFTIFKNYGYRLVENQPVWFIEKLLQNPNFFIFKLVFAVLVLSFLVKWIKTWEFRSGLAYFLLALGASLAAWLQIRNFALFGFLALPIMAENFGEAFRERPAKSERFWKIAASLAVGVVFIIVIAGKMPEFLPNFQEFGIGLAEGNSAASDFFKENKIKGPIFNNYDIGGYLIYHLFPEERVFTDNRPEAYPADFFQNTYIPMQEDGKKWQEAEQKYNFNAIIFSWRDATPWGQKFLLARAGDRDWAPVFADPYVIIFVKRNEANQAVIEKHEIPKEFFRIASAGR